MITNLLTEDNLPSYHRVIAENFSLDDAWGFWWAGGRRGGTAFDRDARLPRRHPRRRPGGAGERACSTLTHATTRSTMPARCTKLEPTLHQNSAFEMILSVAYVSFQELATRVSHRNTGKACGDPIADHAAARGRRRAPAHDLYRNIVSAALDVVPDLAMAAIYSIVSNFAMPGATMPNFRRNAVLIAKDGIYDLPQHRTDVLAPVPRKWRIFRARRLRPRRPVPPRGAGPVSSTTSTPRSTSSRPPARVHSNACRTRPTATAQAKLGV